VEINGADFLEGGAFGIGQPFPSRMVVGHSIGYFYGLKPTEFQNQAELMRIASRSWSSFSGDIRYVDVNGDGEISFDDRTDIGDLFRRQLWVSTCS
jgi:hypothetical protein